MTTQRNAKGCPEILIAIIDGPVDLSHPCFTGASLISGGDASLVPKRDCQATEHGTHVASVIFGQGKHVKGIVPSCRGVLFPVFGKDPGRPLACSQTDLARAIVSAVDIGAHIVNISGGQLDFSEDPDQLLKDALDLCEKSNVLVVAAAGNDGCNCPHTPASYPTVLSVGALDSLGKPLSISNWATSYIEYGLLAPGDSVLGAKAFGSAFRATGTSFATPIVSASAALLLCDQVSHGEIPEPLLVRETLIQAAHRTLKKTKDQSRHAGILDFSLAEKIINQRRKTMTHDNNDIGNSAQGVEPDTEIFASGVKVENVSESQFDFDRTVDVGDRLVEAACGDSACSCARNNTPPSSTPIGIQNVYALGSLGFDFGSESRRDSIIQYIPAQPGDVTDDLMIQYLYGEGAVDAERLIWTISVDNTPIYALQPAGAYGFAAFETIIRVFELQTKRGIPRVAIPGTLHGSVRLMSGEVVPVLVPRTKGITPWDVGAAVSGWVSQETGTKKGDAERKAMEEPLGRFLDDFIGLITRKYKNLGLSGSERALNFASTDVFRAFDAIDQIKGFDLVLDDILVEKSSVCRPGSSCYDVRLRLFTPSNVQSAIQVIQWTVDVSDPVPVSLGNITTWSERPRN